MFFFSSFSLLFSSEIFLTGWQLPPPCTPELSAVIGSPGRCTCSPLHRDNSCHKTEPSLTSPPLSFWSQPTNCSHTIFRPQSGFYQPVIAYILTTVGMLVAAIKMKIFAPPWDRCAGYYLFRCSAPFLPLLCLSLEDLNKTKQNPQTPLQLGYGDTVCISDTFSVLSMKHLCTMFGRLTLARGHRPGASRLEGHPGDVFVASIL